MHIGSVALQARTLQEGQCQATVLRLRPLIDRSGARIDRLVFRDPPQDQNIIGMCLVVRQKPKQSQLRRLEGGGRRRRHRFGLGLSKASMASEGTASEQMSTIISVLK